MTFYPMREERHDKAKTVLIAYHKEHPNCCLENRGSRFSLIKNRHLAAGAFRTYETQIKWSEFFGLDRCKVMLGIKRFENLY